MGPTLLLDMQSTLSRTTRLLIEPQQAPETAEGPGNNHAGWPTPTGLCAWFEIVVELTADPDPETGYIVGIDVVDQVIRTVAYPLLSRVLKGETPMELGALVRQIHHQAGEQLGTAPSTLRLRLSPRHELAWRVTTNPEKDDTMPPSTECLLIREQFEFAASHRLHCPDQSDEWNRSTFGKCNNAKGHGHNYRVEVVARTTMDAEGVPTVGFSELEGIVKEQVISRFDHRHLNEECIEFAELNPSVENIARVCRELIKDRIRQAGGELDSITVWETEKTSCTCRG